MATVDGVRCTIVRDRFGDEVLPSILRMLFLSYETSYEACNLHFDEHAEIRTVLPFFRRGMIEQGLRTIGQVHEHIETQNGEDASGFWGHVQLIANDLILTQSSCDEQLKPHSDAQYREELSQSARRQLLLFTDEQLANTTEDLLSVYGLLLHRRSVENPSLLGSAVIRFPDESQSAYFDEQLDLFCEFPDVVAEFMLVEDGVNEIQEPTLPIDIASDEAAG